MTHDSLCYRSHDQTLGRDPFCQCQLIAQVREDMAAQFLVQEREVLEAYEAGQREMLAKCIATVEELFTIDRWAGLYLAANALRALQEKT